MRIHLKSIIKKVNTALIENRVDTIIFSKKFKKLIKKLEVILLKSLNI